MATVRTVEADLGWRIPDVLRDVYEGRIATGEPFIYPLDGIVERNATFEISEYGPDLVLIGDDGGGRGFFIVRGDPDPDPDLLAIDLGAVGSDEGEVLGRLSVLLARGFDFVESASYRGISEARIDTVDVLLAKKPEAGTRAIWEIRRSLRLSMALSELAGRDAEYPIVLLSKVRLVKYEKLISALNQSFECLDVRPHGL
ncbi:hypothetical protein AB0M46_37895 [Dactylosporangium sp. NPDC051485]|uniref:hypothetical protein n=1 Tax=Dactylosporangium sp. NPDC051485 TaxID=3154846 RepID=UPI00341EE898